MECEQYIESRDNGEFFYHKCHSKAKCKIDLDKGMLLNGKLQISVCGKHFNMWKKKLERHKKLVKFSEIK